MFQCTFRTGCLENTWFCKMMNELLNKIRTYRIQALNLVALKQTLINKVEKNLEETISLISRFLKKKKHLSEKICTVQLYKYNMQSPSRFSLSIPVLYFSLSFCLSQHLQTLILSVWMKNIFHWVSDNT